MKQLIDIRDDELPLVHTFSEGIYAREIFMPKGMIVVGHVHNTTHLNMVSKGSALVMMNGIISKITAPFTFESKAGVRKVLYILEDMYWTTVHVTNETDITVLESTLVNKDESGKIEMNNLIKNFTNEVKKIGE